MANEPVAPGRPGVKDGDYLPTLDGWRAVAIVWVMACHSQGRLFGPEGWLPCRALARAAERGTFGVDLFFALSGLLITARLLKAREREGRIDLRGFYLRRAFRILPPFLAYLAVLGGLWAAGVVHLQPIPYASCFVFLRNLIPEPYMSSDPFDAHAWSLSVEEHFYLLWPCLLGLLATVRRARRAAFALALLSIGWSFLDINLRITTTYLHLPINHHYWRTDYSLGGLLLGAWAALLLADPAYRDRLARWLRPAAWWAMLGLFVWLATSVRENAARAIVTPIVPLLLAGTLLHPKALAGRVLEWGTIRYVGRISYSLYLWQQVFMIPETKAGPFGAMHTVPLSCIGALGCALMSYYLIERPAVRQGHRMATRRARRLRGPHVPVGAAVRTSSPGPD